jgi:hypothetical protein
LEFEESKFKDGLIRQRVFTEEFRRGEAGTVIEQISLYNDFKTIRNMASRILSRNFVKIEGRIMSIDAVCR